MTRTIVLALALCSSVLMGCYASHDPRGDVGPVDAVVPGPGIVTCTPGNTVTVACGSRGLGSCSGDPVLLVCDASLSVPERCNDDSLGLLGVNDDDGTLCPGLEVRCPSSGRLAVRARPFGGGTFECRWDTRSR